MTSVKSAELYAKDKHKHMTRDNGTTPYSNHLEAVVNRLKGLGVTDEAILCAGWLHDTLEDTDATFDEINNRFGQKCAVLVYSLSKNKKLPKKEKEIQYVKLLKDASFEAKLVKLCDISANLKDMENSNMSKTKKKKTVKQKLHYLRVIKNEISEHLEEYPKISELIHGINQVLKEYHQKPITL